MVWIVLFILSVPIPNEHSRFKGKSDKIKTVLIIITLYYMIYFLLGLFFGYQTSPYARTFFSVLKNIIFVVGILLLREYVRNKLVNKYNNIKRYIIVTIVFIIINLDYANFLTNFENGATIFKFVSEKLIPQIAISCICTYLAKTGGYWLIIAYRLPIALATVLLPIFPNIDSFVLAVLETLVPVIIYIYINYEHTIKVNRLTRKQKKNISPTKSAKLIIITIILIVFITGLFPYKPIAIMSNSMVPDFYRGYVVISKKVKKEDIKKIEVGDILEYQLESNAIIHRVIQIEEKDGMRIFTTKGDNNDFPDMKKVEEKQVLGVVKFKIPYVGYPSVWFSEFLFKRKSMVRT